MMLEDYGRIVAKQYGDKGVWNCIVKGQYVVSANGYIYERRGRIVDQ